MFRYKRVFWSLLVIIFFATCSTIYIKKISQNNNGKNQQTNPNLQGYLISVSTIPKGAGKVILSPQRETYPEGTTVNLVAKAKFGYVFDYWKKDQTGGNFIVIDGNKKVIAVFKKSLSLSYLLFFISVLSFIFVFYKSYLYKNKSIFNNENQIKLVEEKNEQLFSLNKKDSVQFILSLWRIENYTKKILKEVDDDELISNSCKAINNALNKINRYLRDNQIEITDYSNHKYNTGLNVDVLAFETKAGSFDPIIKETIEPMILKRGQLIHKAKVIVLRKKEE